MVHQIPAIRANMHARYSASATPVCVVDSGDVVVFETPDVGWGLEPPTSTVAPRRKVEPRDPVKDNGPCLCGPVGVRGARPGDTLEIAIEHLRPSAWGWTYAGTGMSTPGLNAALGVADVPLTLMRWTLDADRTLAANQFGHRVRTRPFLGMIGLAPAEADAEAWTPRVCGGNMDCRELVAGTTLYLPVCADGALLSVGDGHGAQGDGELSGTAIECAMEEVRLRLTLRSDLHVRSPRVRTPEGWITLGFGATLDEAAGSAASAMLDLMVEQFGISRTEALALSSAQVDLRVTQMVNPHRGVHAVLRALGGADTLRDAARHSL